MSNRLRCFRQFDETQRFVSILFDEIWGVKKERGCISCVLWHFDETLKVFYSISKRLRWFRQFDEIHSFVSIRDQFSLVI